MEYESFITPDYKRIIFNSERPNPTNLKGEIWYSDKTKAGWSNAKYLDDAINKGWAMFVTSSKTGTLYFTGGYNGNYGLFKSELDNDKYTAPEYLPDDINSLQGAHPFISPDESFLLFDAQPSGMGKTDLYVSFNQNGKWTEAVKFDESINATKTEGIPSLSPDGKYLFFHRESDIFWVDAKVIDKLNPAKN